MKSFRGESNDDKIDAGLNLRVACWFMRSQLTKAVQENISMSGTLRSLDRARVGTNYRLVKRLIQKFSISTAHWKGLRHGTSGRPKLKPEEILKDGSGFATSTVKKVIIRHKLIAYICAECKMEPLWNGKPLVLRLDHQNGMREDHRPENLRFLCPNCDSQSDTFCGRNKTDYAAKAAKMKCRFCGNPCSYRTSTNRCKSCAEKQKCRKTKIAWPPLSTIIELVKNSSFLSVGKQLGVSDNAIRKHLRSITKDGRLEGTLNPSLREQPPQVQILHGASN